MERRAIYNGDTSSQAAPARAALSLRVCAFLIDHILITLLVIAPTMILLFRDMDAALDRILTLVPIAVCVAFLLYALKDIVKGRSPGKALMGLAVRAREHPAEPPPVGALILRNLFAFLWPIDFLLLVCSADKLKIGDRLAGTDVYRIPIVSRMSSGKKTLLIVLVTVLLFVTAVGGLVFGVLASLRNHPSYEMAVSYIEEHAEILDIVGEIERFSLASGSISYSGGSAQAEHVIRVIGSEDTVRAYVRLARAPGGDWEIIRFQFRR